MEIARLCGGQEATECEVVVATSSDLNHTVIVRRGIVESDSLKAHREQSLDFIAHVLPIGTQRIVAKNPFIGDTETSHLDARGIVQPGTIASDGMVAVSAVRDTFVPSKGPLDRPRPAPAGKEWCVDASLRFGEIQDGYQVTDVVFESARERPNPLPRGMRSRAKILLSRADALQVGDVLRVDKNDLTVAEIRDDKDMPTNSGTLADLIIPEWCHTDVAQTTTRVSRLLPTAADQVIARDTGRYSLITARPLQRNLPPITSRQISWLRRNGFLSLAGEFVSLKCDDLANRATLMECAEGKRNLPIDIPAGCPESLDLVIQTLRCLGLDPIPKDADGSVELSLAPATTDRIQELGPAVIRKPETINYRTFQDEPDGLFCEKAFGSEFSRVRRGAHIKLAAPIVPRILRMGKQPVLASLLDVDPSVVEDIVEGKTEVTVRAGSIEFEPKGKDIDASTTGPTAIERLLQAKGLDEHAPLFLHQAIYVTPPYIRPLVLLDSGNFATADLNDFYRRVINSSNRLRKLMDFNAPTPIILNDQLRMQECVDRLHANHFVPSPTIGNVNPMKDALAMVLDWVCQSAKRVDWSAAARLCIDNAIEDGVAVIPSRVYDTLKCQHDSPILLTNVERFVACHPNHSEDPVIRINGRMAKLLELETGDVCPIHRPITPNAVEEARQIWRDGSTLENRSAVAAELPEDILEELVDCIRSGEPFSLESDQRFLTGGPGSIVLADQVQDRQPPEVLAVDKETTQTPTLQELRASIDLPAKTTCQFQIKKTQDDPPPEAGRVGGRPWVPPGHSWPTSANGPIPFLAQVPLDMAAKRNALPFPVDPNSMLTIFWADDWWELGSSSSPAIFIHPATELVQIEPPKKVHSYPLCSLTWEERLEAPSCDEVVDLLHIQFTNLPKDLVREFRDTYAPKNEPPCERSRVGGYGFWVQTPLDNLVLQLCSEDEAGLCFGDVGSLYVTGTSPNALQAQVQCY